MNTYVALLRGINVGGHKKILMADLRVLMGELNFQNVKTYIQSGNVVFQSAEKSKTLLEEAIAKQILEQYGFEVAIIIKTHQELKSIFNECPFSVEKKEDSYFMLLCSKPDTKLIEQTNLISYPNEEFIISHNCVYFYCSVGYGKAKLGNNFFEKKLKVSATARNYKTMVKLIEMSA